jgi:hypothetical protein
MKSPEPDESFGIRVVVGIGESLPSVIGTVDLKPVASPGLSNGLCIAPNQHRPSPRNRKPDNRTEMSAPGWFGTKKNKRGEREQDVRVGYYRLTIREGL